MQVIHNPNTYKIDGCFLDKEKRFCYIHIYKNASISLRNALGMRGNYFKYEEVKSLNLPKICIIRHPINRIVSIFLYLLRNEDYGFQDQHPTDLIRNSAFFQSKDDDVLKSFELFLKCLEHRNYFSAVALPQTTFLEHRDLKIDDIEEILIQETIEDDFKKFVEKYDLGDIEFPFDNKHENSTKSKILDFINSNPDIEKQIKVLYKEDFELYDLIVSSKTFE